MEEIPYGDYKLSTWYMYNMIIGNTDVEAFGYGNGTEAVYLYILFIGSSFFILIHLLNMLIAIMGETFNKRSDVSL